MKKRIIFIRIIMFSLIFTILGCGKKDGREKVEMTPEPTGEVVATYMQWETPPEMAIDTMKIYVVTIKIKQGEIKIQLFADKAPNNVNNFIFLINEGFYLKTTFHRVEPGFIAQAGKPPIDNLTGPGYFVKDEIHPELHFDAPGWVAMAKKRTANSNGSQFFITYEQAPWLNDKYTIIGKVAEGMDVVNAITPKNDHENNEYPGDPILDMTVTGISGSLLPPPQPPPIPKAPELTGGRPLANIPFEEKGFIYQKAPGIVINVNKSYTAVFKTTKGDIHFELNVKDAPVHVNNFYVLVKLGYYDNFPITNVLRARYAVTGTPDKTPRSDIGYALPAEVKMKQVQGTLCAWLHAKRDKERSSSGSMIAMIMTNAPGGINAFTYFGITDKAGLEIANTLTTEDIINKVEIIVK